MPWVPRGSPRGEEAGPARDELRVPGEEENSKHAEKDEHGLFGKPMAQMPAHGDPGLGRATAWEGPGRGPRCGWAQALPLTIGKK